MPFFQKTKDEIVTNGLNALDTNTNITQMTPGGKARFFMESTGIEQSNQSALFDANILQPYIQFAENKFLDFFGDMLDLPRLEATHAESTDDNFIFYVDTGTFGDLNNNNNFTIPAGTIIQTTAYDGEIFTPGLSTQQVVTYTTLEPAVCESDSSFVSVSIRSNQEGKASSVSRDTLKTHNFTNYILSSTGLLKCTNRYAIDNGDERESNPSYRYRLLQVFRSRNQAIRASIRLAALSVPGVSDVLMINNEQGPGTYSLYIKGLTPTVSPSLLETVSAQVALVSAEGIRSYVLAPNTVGMEFVAALYWNPKVTAEQQSREYKEMRKQLESYMNGLDIGESVELVELIEVLLNAAPNVFSIGQNKRNEFEEVYINRPAPDGNGSARSIMFGKIIEPLYNERIVLQTSNNYRGIQFINASN